VRTSLRALIALGALSTGALLACADDSVEGTVNGTMKMVGGPAAEEVESPAPGQVHARPFPGDSRGEAAEVETADDGTFELRLKPGTYQITGTSPSFNYGCEPCGNPELEFPRFAGHLPFVAEPAVRGLRCHHPIRRSFDDVLSKGCDPSSTST
jgi:hypothetical protein